MLNLTNQTQIKQQPAHKKVLTFAGLPGHKSINVEFLYIFLDDSKKQQNLYSILKIDGNTILKKDLLKNINHSASTLTLEWFPNNELHGCKNFQTMTIITISVNSIKNPPKVKNIIHDKTIYAYSNFQFTLNASIMDKLDGNSLILNAYLNNGSPKATCQSFDPTIPIQSDLK